VTAREYSAAGALLNLKGRKHVRQELFLAGTLASTDGGAQTQPGHHSDQRPRSQNFQD
jgi:hypothetical protein